MGRNALTYTFKYSNGKQIVRRFKSVKKARQFAHNEGDHLVDWCAGNWTKT